jgi:glycosyltransferase involved in cell wall biosynthesis
MRVLYDGVVFQNSYQRGIQRAFYELLSHMPATVEPILALSGSPKSPLPARARPVRLGLSFASLLPRAIRRAVQARLAPPAMRRLAANCSVFHSTYFTLPPGPMPTVLHVHDLLPERFPECFDAAWAAQEVDHRRRAIEQATRIVAISDATSREIAHFYPGAHAKTSTIYWGCDHLARNAPSPPQENPPPYALYVGDRAGYKNFSLLLDAMERSDWPHDVGLKVVGPAWRDSERPRVEHLLKDCSLEHVGRATDDHLARLYAHARCLVAPSFGEGFGFPLLEAQSLDVPVVCAATPVFREIAGDAALYFDPHRSDELSRRVKEAGDTATRARLTTAARSNLTRFSWQRCADQTAALYGSLLSATP